MPQIILRRILLGILVVWIVTTVVFIIMRVIPGDPARLISAQGKQELIPLIRQQLGLDKPLVDQYFIFLRNSARGDFSYSYHYRDPVMRIVIEHFPITLGLAVISLGISLSVSLPLGIVAAVNRGRWIDRLVLGISVLGQSIPSFWIAMMLSIVFVVRLQLLPAIGYQGFKSFILPAFSLAIGLIAIQSQAIRAVMVDILDQDYIAAARARGIPMRRVIVRHALPNAAIVLLTLVGLQFGYLLGGAIVIEYIFGLPGLGFLAIVGGLYRDYPLLQAVVIFFAAMFVLLNIAVDISYSYIDPRVRARTLGTKVE